MATNKTLTPTNVTIAIPAMTDTPDAAVFSNCIDKEADAVNTLNNRFANLGTSTASTKDGMITDACTAFIALGINNTPLPVRIAWSGHDYYIGTMQKTSGNIVNYTLSTTDDINSGRYANSTVTNNGINDQLANKIIVVRYSASLEANQYVTAPFTHYAEITLDTSKGTPICARINGSSTKSKVASFTAGSGKCFVQGIGAEDITVDITYIKNPATT